jgi:hypothetical protein
MAPFVKLIPSNVCVCTQNAGRSGIDQWNFFMNPLTSAKNADPTGEYTRRWIPELSHLPTAALHKPWEGGQKGSYPRPIVDPGSVLTRANAEVIGEMQKVKRDMGPEWTDKQVITRAVYLYAFVSASNF